MRKIATLFGAWLATAAILICIDWLYVSPWMQAGNAATSADVDLMLSARLWCMEADYCKVRVRDSTVQVLSIYNKREHVLEAELPRGSQVLSILASLCDHKDCEIEGDDQSAIIRQDGRDAAMLLHNDDGRISTHILAPAMARE